MENVRIFRKSKLLAGLVVGLLFILPVIAENASATYYQNYSTCTTAATSGISGTVDWSGNPGTTLTPAAFDTINNKASMGINLKTYPNQWAYVWEKIAITGVSFTATSTSHTIVYSWNIDVTGEIQTTAGTGGYLDVYIFGGLLNSAGQSLPGQPMHVTWTLNANADGSKHSDSVNIYDTLTYTYTGLTVGATYKFYTGVVGEVYIPSGNNEARYPILTVRDASNLYYERN